MAVRVHESAVVQQETTRKTIDVLGVHVDTVCESEAVEQLLEWAANRESGYVCLSNVHSIITGHNRLDFRQALSKADLVLPDGWPVAWLMRKLGVEDQERIPGPDLMWTLCQSAQQSGIPVGFFGTSPEAMDALLSRLACAFPKLKVHYAVAPPHRSFTQEEVDQTIRQVNASGIGILFVGLGCPRQEFWMAETTDQIHCIQVGVGAALDIYAGKVSRAPKWMQKAGLEWLFRLVSEPGRLWKRYLFTNTQFVFLAARELLLRKN
ncbi:MAG: WecB/TagA/CpsF family glycosyltransferase [Armatimonadetes bacterium]|nr:WecB/TagA/CpsF family glycosyltransferase [Armatimonadota bacterium]